MSEALRSRLYDWFCEHIDEPTAEYAMSCLSPVPVSELATKDDIERLDTAIERLDAKFEADRKEARHQFHWLVGLGATGFGVLLAARFALAAIS